MKLTIRQKKAVQSDAEHILCLSAAGGGKTTTMTERIKDLILNKFIDPRSIVAITFTNLAAEEIKKRLGSIANGAFIGTVHSYANQLCVANGIDTAAAINEKNFDLILKKALTIPRSKFPHVQHLLIDEAQDLGSLDFAFIERCHVDNIFFVGDDRQAIYGFRGCSDRFIRYLKDDPTYTKFFLVDDFRNAPNILEFANDFLGSYHALGPEAKAYKTQDGIVEECPLEDALYALVQDGNWSSWFILARTNNEIAEIQEILNEMEVPNVTFKRGDFDDLAEMEDLIASNRVKVMTIHACMSGDTLIPTSKGIQTIKKIVDEKDSELLVYNGEYYDRIADFINNGKEMTYTLTTKTGNSIRLTQNHDVMILTSEGIEKRKVKDLVGGENVLLRKNIQNYQYETISLKQVLDNEVYFNVVRYNTPKVLDENLAELIGMITADGTHNKTSIHYYKRHKECVDRFAELVKICFGKEITIQRSNRENAWFTECNSRYILEFLKKNFDGIENNEKFISSIILQSSQQIQCAFLRGLFEDGTVGLKKERVDNITLTFKNSKMLYQLQTLLFSLGIDASFATRHYVRDINSLNYCYIYSTGISVFKEKIGFISDFKQERLNSFKQKYQRKNKSSVFREILLLHKNELYITGQSRFWSNLNKNQGLTDGIFFKYYELLTEEQKQKGYIQLIKNVFEKYLVEEIQSIVPYQEEETYCLTMEHESQFIQNGFLMGNSKGLQSKNVIVTGAKIYNEEERKIAYVAATRAENALYWCPSFSRYQKKGLKTANGCTSKVFKKSEIEMIQF